MKNRANQILLAASFLTAALYVYFLLVWIEGIPRPFYDPNDPFRFYELWVYLGVGFHVVPCFCLQLLICRAAKRPAIRLIPVFLLAGLVAVFLCALVNAEGLDGLGWILLLMLCIAPAVGCALAWAVYGIQWYVQHRQGRQP